MQCKRYAFFAIILFGCFGIFFPAFAHVLKTDGNMGVVLHIDPDDNPKAGSPATIIFQFKSKQSGFTLAQCDCRLSIRNSAGELLGKPLSDVGSDTAAVPYTFPQKDAYSIIISGKPAAGTDFSPFRVQFDWRIDAGESAAAPAAATNFWGEHGLHIILFSLAIAANLFFLLRNGKRNRPQSGNLPKIFTALLLSGSLWMHAAGHTTLHQALDPHDGQAHACCISTTAALSAAEPASTGISQYAIALVPLDEQKYIASKSPDNKSPPLRKNPV